MTPDESPKLLTIRICMGSSCFSRGNNRTLATVQDYLKTRGLEDVAELSGSLCEGRCKKGPNITINGVQYENVDRNMVVDLLEFHVKDARQAHGTR